MSGDIAIKVEHVSKNFVLPHEKTRSVKSAFTNIFTHNRTKESQHALNDISFEVKKGEFFGIVGRNGSGKSTMLKILAGIYQPTQGQVHTHGKLVPFIELGVGFNPELTGRENVYLNGAMLGFSEKEVESMYDDIVAFAELERFMDQKLKNYSSGMQVRLAFSMATRSNAEILLVDEVLAVGDADFQRKCFEYFRELKKNKKTVVFVSHDMNAVREYCDRAVLIEKNQLVMEGDSDSVATAYSRMFIEGTVSDSKIPAGARWGSKEAAFKKFELNITKLTDDDKQLVITTRIVAHEQIDDVVMGFFIKSPAGMLVAGTNSQILKKIVRSMEKGQELELTWSVPNIFSEGTYEITGAVESGGRICDWWEGAATFHVVIERQTPYVVSPAIKLTVEGQNK